MRKPSGAETFLPSKFDFLQMQGDHSIFTELPHDASIQGSAKRSADIVKQQPGRARQKR